MQAFAKRNDGMKFDGRAYWDRNKHAGFENTLILLHNVGEFRRMHAASAHRDHLRAALSCLKAVKARPFHRSLP